MRYFIFSLFVFSLHVLPADEPAYPVAKVNYADYMDLVEEVQAHRAERLIDFESFLEMSKKPNVVILDTRSKFRFDRIHLKGAKHLNFSDFTQDRLKEVIPGPETVVLIYCNNNFAGNQIDFASKIAMPSSVSSIPEGSLRMLVPSAPPPVSAHHQISAQETPLMLALNVPTYLNLYGYGYRNVYELHELVDVDDDRVEFVGSIIEP